MEDARERIYADAYGAPRDERFRSGERQVSERIPRRRIADHRDCEWDDAVGYVVRLYDVRRRQDVFGLFREYSR